MPAKILVADDSAVFRELEEQLLARHGYAVVQAVDGASTIKLALSELPDLILLDLQMPVVDGVQVLSLLKQNPNTKDIPIIVVSTIGRERDRDILLKGGADAFVPKPIDPADLLQRIRQLVGE